MQRVLVDLLAIQGMKECTGRGEARRIWCVDIRAVNQQAMYLIRAIQRLGGLDAAIADVICITTEQPDDDDDQVGGDDDRVVFRIKSRRANGLSVVRRYATAEAAAAVAFKHILQRAGHSLVAQEYFLSRAEQPGDKRVKTRRYLLDSDVLAEMGFNTLTGRWFTLPGANSKDACQQASATPRDGGAEDSGSDNGSSHAEDMSESEGDEDAVDDGVDDVDSGCGASPDVREVSRGGTSTSTSSGVADVADVAASLHCAGGTASTTPSASGPSPLGTPLSALSGLNGVRWNSYHVLADKSPQGLLTYLRTIASNSVNVGLTSPIFNLVGLRTSAGYSAQRRVKYDICLDNMPETEYQEWQIAVLNELYRIIKPDGVLLYNHYSRHVDEALFHPLEFICHSLWRRPHREIILERPTTGNQHAIVPQTHEYMYVLTKGGKQGPSRPRWDKSGMQGLFSGSVWKLRSSQEIRRGIIDHPCCGSSRRFFAVPPSLGTL